jgi:hypothetical protein
MVLQIFDESTASAIQEMDAISMISIREWCSLFDALSAKDFASNHLADFKVGAVDGSHCT